MNGESLIGPSLIGAGAFLFGWLIGRGGLRSRRVWHGRECPLHGIFNEDDLSLADPVCPICGSKTKLVRVKRVD